jgi:anthranilate phosphoribosyltransferase
VAGAGYKVAKHGNYGATSVSGSSNVLEYFGAKFTTDESVLKKSLDRSGFAYLHAPIFNPAMKHVAPVRKNLGVRTFFNVLGPLISPARPRFQCLGVYNLKMMRLYSYIYQQLGIQYSIVHSLDGYDEVSLTDKLKLVNNQANLSILLKQWGTKPSNRKHCGEVKVWKMQPEFLWMY